MKSAAWENDGGKDATMRKSIAPIERGDRHSGREKFWQSRKLQQNPKQH
jgi:hypothetical protein